MLKYLINNTKQNEKIIKRFSHYETLKVKQTATTKEIKDSYYKLSKRFHPDVNKESNAESKFKEIQAAYHVIGDEERKIEYDRRSDEVYESGSNNPFNRPSSSINFQRTRWKARVEKKNGNYSKPHDFEEYYRQHYSEYMRRRQAAIQFEEYLRQSTGHYEIKRPYQNARKTEFDDKEIVKTKFLPFFIFVVSVVIGGISYINNLKRKEHEFEKKALERSAR
jgi:DnaJ-class molecular chaperone